MSTESITYSHDYWMQHALRLAHNAARLDEVPVGAILVLNDKIIGEGANQPITAHDPTAHAEIIALRQAGEAIGNYRLVDSTLYVTLEPCMMCAGAMVHARIRQLIFGAYDPKSGAVVSKAQVLNHDFLNHRVSFLGGICQTECGTILSNFFKSKR